MENNKQVALYREICTNNNKAVQALSECVSKSLTDASQYCRTLRPSCGRQFGARPRLPSIWRCSAGNGFRVCVLPFGAVDVCMQAPGLAALCAEPRATASRLRRLRGWKRRLPIVEVFSLVSWGKTLGGSQREEGRHATNKR